MTRVISCCLSFFFFNDTATTEIYTLSLHDALPIYSGCRRYHRKDPSRKLGSRVAREQFSRARQPASWGSASLYSNNLPVRSEEHTSELQSRLHLVCRLLLEKKNMIQLLLISHALRA